MSIVFHWPQIVWAVIFGLGLLASLVEAALKNNADKLFRFVLTMLLSFGLLYAGGFFAGGVCL